MAIAGYSTAAQDQIGVQVLTFFPLALSFYLLRSMFNWVVIVLSGMDLTTLSATLREHPWLRPMCQAWLQCTCKVEPVWAPVTSRLKEPHHQAGPISQPALIE